jgi:type IV pilus assembly protein PilC/MSHA biogenesis protein MshG
MPAFEYSATSASGGPDRGVVVAKSPEDAADQLSRRGLTSVKIQAMPDLLQGPRSQSETPRVFVPGPDILPPRSPLATHVIGPAIGTIPLEALQFFFRQLGVMLNAGVNPVQTVETLAANTSSRRLAEILREASRSIQEGRPFSATFERYPEAFNPLIIGLVKAAEEGGFLADQCLILSDYLKNEIELRNLIRRETFYPKAVIGAAILIFLGANLIIGALAPGGRQLESPLTNPAVWAVIIPLFIAGWIFIRYGLKVRSVRRVLDTIYISLPGIRQMAHGFAMAKFGRAFGALYRGGVPLQKAVRLGADACGNEAVRQRILPCVHRLEEGEGITEVMRATNAFNPIVLDMIHTGEMTGELDHMLNRMAEFYEEEGKTKARQAAILTGVVAFLAVAIYVGYIVISFYTGFAADRVGGALAE